MTPRHKPLSCESCPLLSAGSDFAQSEGTGRLRTMIVGEANGEMEARDQLPFRQYAPAGAILTRTIRRLGLDREDFAISNLLRCRPPNNVLDSASYEYEAVEKCQPNLLALLRQFKPKVLLAMGNLPTKHLTGLSGEKRGVGHLRGYVLRALPQFEEAAGRNHDSDPLLVIPTYHPAFLRRGAIHLTGVLARDIARAVNVATGRDRQFILDLPDLSLRDFTCQYDPAANPDPWDAAYRDWEQRRKQEMQQDLAAWLTANNLRYQLHPTRRDLDLFCRDVKARSDSWLAMAPTERETSLLCLSHDIETYESASLDEDATDGFTDTQVRLSQFSVEPGQGIALQWGQDGIAATRWLLKLPLPKCGHNYALFDLKVLQAVGKRDFGDRNYFLPSGQVHDTLQMFHFFQPDLPAHLQFAASFSGWMFPWKHLNETCLELYGCIDTDVTLRVYETVRHTLEDRRMWLDNEFPSRAAVGYLAQVEQIRPVLAAMEDRGFPIDDEKRQMLGKEFEIVENEERERLNQRFPDEARKVQPYKTVPKQVKEMLEGIRPTSLPAENAQGENGKPLTKTARTRLEKEALAARWNNITPEELAVIRARKFQDSPTKNEEGELEEGESYYFDLRSVAALEGQPVPPVWCRVYDFSPNSSQQLMAYMTAHRHKIPQSKDGKKTTGKKDLERLSAKFKDNFYLKVIECRELGKARGTYIDGYRPHEDGRVHTTFTFDTGTQQTSSRNPNIQNVSKNARLAKAIREMYRDAGGKLIVEWDFKSYHALTTGFCARSKNYMRLARLDIHSFLGWHFLRLPKADELVSLPDDDLRDRLKWFKSDEKRKYVREKQAKPACHGVNFGMGYRKLYDMNREYFEGEGQAKHILDMMKALFPEVFAWQDRQRQLAHQQTFIRNRFGAMRWFYEVCAPDGRGGLKPGEQSEEAIAFQPASEAFGNMREIMKALAREGLDEKWEMVNQVHDSLLFLVLPGNLEEHCAKVYPILHAPSKVLIDPELAPGGLVVDVDCMAGVNWAAMREVGLTKK